MRLAFLGTPDFSVSALRALVDAGHEVAMVYAQPPAPRGRGQDLRPSPVQAFAEKAGLPVRTPASMRDPAEITAFAALALDVAVVVAFGQILPAAVLDAPRLGSVNLHASCCRAGGAPRRSSGPSWRETRSRALRPCA